MRANARSISGAALMLVIIPIFAGLLACMPEHVPLGNPEKARVDEDMSGMWFVQNESSGLIGNFVLLEPWDKRTWLITTVVIEESGSGDLNDFEYEGDETTYDGFVGFFEHPEVDVEALEFGAIQYKGWLVKLGGETFITWELRVVADGAEELLKPWYWQDLRVTEVGPDRMVMHLIDDQFPPLQEAPKTRRDWEKVVRKNADNDELYEEGAVVFTRVKEDDLELFIELLNYSVWGPIL